MRSVRISHSLFSPAPTGIPRLFFLQRDARNFNIDVKHRKPGHILNRIFTFSCTVSQTAGML